MVWWRTKGSLYVLGGALLAMLGGFGIIGAFGYDAQFRGRPGYDPSLLPGLSATCGLLGILPGIVLIYLGMRAKKESQALVEFSSWVRTYRRIGLVDLARKLGKSEIETEKILADAIDKRLVFGYVDRTTGEFVSWESAGGQVLVQQCPHCSATVNRLYMAGETILCPYCNSVIPASALRPA